MLRAAARAFPIALFLAAIALVSACAGGGAPAGPNFQQVAAQLPPVPPDRARLFFYRDYEPYESLSRPYILLNGEVAGISEPGGVFYRDVPPGRYLVSVESRTLYPDQDKTLDLHPGETGYVKVESIQSSNAGDKTYVPDTFTVVVVGPADAERDIASKRYFPNGS
jgi:hypothetical protein